MTYNEKKKGNWWLNRAFLYVGRISRDKGLEQILISWLNLWEVYHEKCPPLWIVGGSPQEIDSFRRELRVASILAEHESTNRIHWWGYLDASGISTLILRSLVLVSHSRYEPGGRVVLEAMAEGIPVIATPHGFSKELIVDWESGFHVGFGDLEKLTLRMEHFIRQPLLRNVLGATARELVKNALNTWRFVDTHFLVYSNVSNLIEQPKYSYTRIQKRRGRSHFAGRCMIPTYPYFDHCACNENINRFIKDVCGLNITSIQFDNSGIGSSYRWIVSTEGKEWLIKQPYSRIATRPLWNPNSRCLVRSQRSRFLSELLAGSMKGFASIKAIEESSCLLLRPRLMQVNLRSILSSLDAAISPLRELYTEFVRIPSDLIHTLNHDWSSANWEDVEAALKTIRYSLSEAPDAWNVNRNFCLRLIWRRRELQLAKGDLRLPQTFVYSILNSLPTFIELAQVENRADIVVCHGSADLDHVVLDENGKSYLVDGDNIHPGWIGEDLAALFGSAIDDCKSVKDTVQTWNQWLDHFIVDSTEKKLTISWAALLALDDICRNMTFLMQDKTSRYMQRWRVLSEVGSQFS